MSAYDDDEALFEDIYDDDANGSKDVKEETTDAKETHTPSNDAVAPVNSAPSSTDAPSNTDAASTDAIPATIPATAPAAPAAPATQETAPAPAAPSYYGSTPTPAPPVVHQPSNIGRESGKMFIGGLNWDTTEEKLVAYFSKFGEVTDHTIMRDNATGKSRGFGFLTFRDPRSVDEVIKTDHVLDGKLIDPKRAIAREEQDRVGKIFVGGIDPMVNERDFNEFFSQFGSIIDAQLMIDKDTGRSRGFGFITYDSPDAVDRVTVNKYLTLKGKTMEVKRAEPRGQHQQNQQQQQQQYGYNYNNQYGQVQNNGQYGQQPQMTPEMMQEYWQRMQQWYMYQQQVAAGQAEGGEQPAQPLNPQQQGEEEQNEPEPPKQPAAFDNRNAGYDNRNSGYENRNDNPHKDARRNNLPKGPRRAPPSGPGAMRGGGRGGRGRGGYQRRGGYHPYNRGGRN